MKEKKLIPDALVWKRYGVSSMTGWRWDHDPALNFPKPFRIKKRKYRSVDELDEFDQRMRPADDTALREHLDDDVDDGAGDEVG